MLAWFLAHWGQLLTLLGILLALGLVNAALRRQQAARHLSRPQPNPRPFDQHPGGGRDGYIPPQ